jgi:hypothetical protein
MLSFMTPSCEAHSGARGSSANYVNVALVMLRHAKGGKGSVSAVPNLANESHASNHKQRRKKKMTRTCHKSVTIFKGHDVGMLVVIFDGFCCGGGPGHDTPCAVNITSLVTARVRQGNIRLPGLLIPRPNGQNGQLEKSDPFIGQIYTNLTISANLGSVWKASSIQIKSQIARDVAGGQGLQNCAETEVQLTEW